ncbi:MAG TPA: LacI family DNA-binding transcriptional regulator [Anaerolineales bacterium]|nr:LacI family DNA-binding transcriptional regulator [Anaerolineales bacterium]
MTALTLDDIAKLAGVSRSTVSRVVNNHPNVSDRARKRVLKVIENTGFQPNAAARALASHRSRMLGFVLPRSVSSFFSDPYFPRLTQGVSQACNQFGYTLGLFLIATDEDEQNIYPQIFRKGLLDGLLVQSGDYGDESTARLLTSSMPTLILGRPFHTSSIPYIDVDNVAAAQLAVCHLIHQGRERVATITGSERHTASMDRKEGYLRALFECGKEIDQRLIVNGEFSEATAYTAMQQLLPAKPDAVFAASDAMAVGAMRAVRDAGLSIPDDIAFVGFDDLPLVNQPEPPLTTIHQPIFHFGFKSVELLIDLIENGVVPPRPYLMPTELIVRESCGARQAAVLETPDGKQ